MHVILNASVADALRFKFSTQYAVFEPFHKVKRSAFAGTPDQFMESGIKCGFCQNFSVNALPNADGPSLSMAAQGFHTLFVLHQFIKVLRRIIN